VQNTSTIFALLYPLFMHSPSHWYQSPDYNYNSLITGLCAYSLPVTVWCRNRLGFCKDPWSECSQWSSAIGMLIISENSRRMRIFLKFQGKDVIQLPSHFVFILERYHNYYTFLLSLNIFRELLVNVLEFAKPGRLLCFR
jgi:hypothetical protein